MKTLIATVAVATLVAAPAFAQAPGRDSGPNTVIFNSKVIGTDPDASIRSQLQRDWETQGRPRPWMPGR